jgi:hypothetical protein
MRFHLPSIAAMAIVIGACADLTTQPDTRDSELTTPAATAALIGSSDPQLLVCPTTETRSARATIGLAGGTVSVGGSSITIPPGAVLVPTKFEVIVPASSYMEVEIHAVGMERYFFLLPATVTIDHSRCPADAVPENAVLQGVYIDSLTKQVLDLMGGDADTDGQTVRFLTGHLSGYAVAY